MIRPTKPFRRTTRVGAAVVPLALAAAAIALAVPGPVTAQGASIVKCESYNNGYNRCFIPTGNQVQLVEQLSKKGCVPQKDWGFDAEHIWVRDGCRALFSVPGGKLFRDPDKLYSADQAGKGVSNWRNGQVYDGNQGRWRQRKNGEWVESQTSQGAANRGNEGFGERGGQVGRSAAPIERKVDCESFGGAYTFCPVGVTSGVTVYLQKSKDGCQFTETWGYQRDGIWVRGGCRATFLVK